MPRLHSLLDPGSATFAANAERMAGLLAEVHALQARVVAESSSKREKFEARGQLLPRERVARLIDRGSGFLELSPLAGLGMHDDDGRKSVQGGGSIVGIGVVAGKQEKPLLKIVPQNNLQAKVYVPNNAIGFLRPGQSAQISLTSFPAADYGRLCAKVLRIGADALTPQEQTRVLGTTASGLYLPAVLQLQRQTPQTGRTSIPLQAGMSLTADIHLRDRRFISVITGLLEDQRRGLERMR